MNETWWTKEQQAFWTRAQPSEDIRSLHGPHHNFGHGAFRMLQSS